MKITFSAPITASDSDSRIVAGQIMPFEKPGNTSAGTVVFAASALGDLEAKEIILNLEHDQSRPVGKSIELSITPGGVYGKFKVANTSAGNDLLVEAAEGLRTGFSIEANVRKHTMKGNTMYVTAADITGCAAVTRPAYGDQAQITEVAASEPDETETIHPSTEGTDMTDQVTSVEETAPAVEASATPVQAAAPIYTRPRLAPLSSGDYMVASIKAATGDHEAQLIVRAADDDTTTNTGLTLPNHLNGFVVNTFASRPTIAACGGASPLPFASGMSYTLPRLTGAPTVTAPGEGGVVSETGITSDYLTVDIARYAGMQTVSLELLERSAPAFADIMLSELQKAYAKATDNAVIAALVAGGTDATNQASSVAGLQAFVALEGPAAYVGTGGDFATELVCNSSWWTALLSENDTTDRPLFSALAPQNAAGSAAVTRAAGTVFGTNFWVDHNITVNGLIDNSAHLIAPGSVHIAESPTTQLRVNVIGTGLVEVSLHGYFAVKVLKAAGVRSFMIA